MPPTWFIISSTPPSYLLQLSLSISTPWKLGIKSGDGEGITCCLQLCSTGLFRHIRLKLPFPERQQWRTVAGAVQDCGGPNRIWSERGLLWWRSPSANKSDQWKVTEEEDRRLHLHCLCRQTSACSACAQSVLEAHIFDVSVCLWCLQGWL